MFNKSIMNCYLDFILPSNRITISILTFVWWVKLSFFMECLRNVYSIYTIFHTPTQKNYYFNFTATSEQTETQLNTCGPVLSWSDFDIPKCTSRNIVDHCQLNYRAMTQVQTAQLHSTYITYPSSIVNAHYPQCLVNTVQHRTQ